QAEQAIVIRDQDDRVVNRTCGAAREQARFARCGKRIEDERKLAQIVDGDDVERSRRHCAVPVLGRATICPSGSLWSAAQRAARTPTAAAWPAGIASSGRYVPSDSDIRRCRLWSWPSSSPVARSTLVRLMLPVSDGLRSIRLKSSARPRRRRQRSTLRPSSCTRSFRNPEGARNMKRPAIYSTTFASL